MALETGTYISDLVATNPASGDNVVQGDDHLRLIKATLLATFPNVTGAVTPTHTEINYVDGVTSAIQTQLDAKAPLASPALSGTPTAPTASAGTNTTQIATTAFVTAAVAATAASGSWVELSQAVLSADTAVDFTGLDNTYDEYMLVLTSVLPSTTAQIYLRTSTDGGSTFDATANDYEYASLYTGSDGSTASTSNSQTGTAVVLTPTAITTAEGRGLNAVLTFGNPEQAANFLVNWHGGYQETSSTALQHVTGTGMREATADVDAIRILPSAGNLASGLITLYGRQK